MIQRLIRERRSIRLMSGDPVSREQLLELFESARWAPSEYNNQPWRFLYIFPENPLWQEILSSLDESNQAWASKAGALIIVLARSLLEYKNKPGKNYMFDTGAACQNISLAASSMGLALCHIGGFDKDNLRVKLEVPTEFELPVILAVGHPRGGCKLPEGSRKTVEEVASEGKFPEQWKVF